MAYTLFLKNKGVTQFAQSLASISSIYSSVVPIININPFLVQVMKLHVHSEMCEMQVTQVFSSSVDPFLVSDAVPLASRCKCVHEMWE